LGDFHICFKLNSEERNSTQGKIRTWKKYGQNFLKAVRTNNTSLVGGNGGTLNTDIATLDSLSSTNSNVVVGFISVGETQIEVLNVQVEVWENQLLLDEGPDDSVT
jgi:hypothetical protein